MITRPKLNAAIFKADVRQAQAALCLQLFRTPYSVTPTSLQPNILRLTMMRHMNDLAGAL